MKNGEKQRIQYIDPHKIHIPERRITTRWTEEDLQEFKEDIAEEGIETPILVAQVGTELYVIDGLHRLQEAMLQNLLTVPCVIKEMSGKKLILRNLAANCLRGEVLISEVIRSVKDAREQHNATVEEIQKGTGFSRQKVETLILISENNPRILDLLDKGIIKVGHAEQLIRCQDRAMQEFYLNWCFTSHPSVKDLTRQITDSLQIQEDRKNNPDQTPPPHAPGAVLGICGCCQKQVPSDQLRWISICNPCLSGALISNQEVEAAIRREAEKTSLQGEERAAGSP